MPEDIPDELGHGWRVLHPFDLPGVRFPTDTTPSNQRHLAKNDALVELIQTTEYLDEVPTWGQRDYRLYPPCYGDPFYRGRGRGRGGQGRREWLQGRQMERPDRGFAGGNSQTNNARPQPLASIDRPTPIRLEDEWSISPTVERRNNTERHQIASMSFPAVPPLQKNIYLLTGVVKVLQEIEITNTSSRLEMKQLEEESLLQESQKNRH